MPDQLIGHQNTLAFFREALKSGRLSHAYCLVGPKKIGKKRVVEEISSELLKIPREKIYNGAEVIFVQQPFDEKTGKTKKNIDIEQIRQMKSSLQLRSASGNYKITIIDDAELMSAAAANALLKILEEPKEKTIFFLLTSDEQGLPQTIKSRCQLIYLHEVAAGEIIAALQAKVADVKKVELIAKAANGRPGQALEWANDEDLFAEYEKERQRFAGLFGKSFYEKLKDVEELFGNKEDHIAEREKLKNVLSLWQILARDNFLEKKSLPVEKYLQLEDAIIFCKEMLKMNIHPRLLVEKILLIMP